MYSHELNDFTGWSKKKPKKTGAKKRRSYRKPIGQNYRKSGDIVVTTQPAQPAQPEQPVDFSAWKSWYVVVLTFFCLSILYTLIAYFILSLFLSSPIADYVALILSFLLLFILLLIFFSNTWKGRFRLTIMILPSGLISIFVLIYCFGFGDVKPIHRVYKTPHYYNTLHYYNTSRDYTTPRDHAPAPREHGSSDTVAGITYHDNPPPDHYNTPDVGDTALCRDGTYSYSQHARGTRSHHSGVLRWDHYPGIIIPGRNPNPPTFFNYKFEPSLSPDIGSETGIEKYQIQTIDRIPGTPVCQKPMVWTERDGCQPKFRNRS